MTRPDIIARFTAATENEWSPASAAGAERHLRALEAWLATHHDVTLLEADDFHLNKFIGARRAQVAANTVIRQHSDIKAFYRWASAGADPYVERNPMSRVPAPKGTDGDPDRMPVATEAQYRALLATCRARAKPAGRGTKTVCDRRDAAILTLLWHLGCRRGELVDVEYRHVDWDTQMIHLPKTKGRGKARSRDVWIDDEAMDALVRYVFERGEHPGPLFETTHRVPGSDRRQGIKPNTITLMLKRRCRQAGLADELGAVWGAHGFRRKWAIDFVASGGDPTALTYAGGWKPGDGRMPARYTQMAHADLAAAEAKRVAIARRGGRHLKAV